MPLGVVRAVVGLVIIIAMQYAHCCQFMGECFVIYGPCPDWMTYTTCPCPGMLEF